jgi:hypothetical protein
MAVSPGSAQRHDAAGEFIERLRCLTDDQLAAVARRVGDVRATAADDVDWWRATVAVTAELRRLHRSRVAAVACRQAAEAVLAASETSEVPHDPVVHVARAACDLARTLVAGGPPSALAVLGRGWDDLYASTASPSRPAAA